MSALFSVTPRFLPSPNKHQGFVLVTGLVLLMVIAIAAISGMQTSNLDYKMASNTAFKDESFQGSETGRTAAGESVNRFIYERTWEGISTPNGLTFNAQTFNPLADNSGGENPFITSTLTQDMTYAIPKSSVSEAVAADVFVLRAPGVTSMAGMGNQQFAGYEGAGKGIANAGAAIYFELRSRGAGRGGAETITASEYRTLIQ